MVKTLKYFMLVMSIGFCGPAMAQEGLTSLAKKVKTMRDSMVVKGVDRRYIDVPEQPWQITVRSNVKQTIVSMNNEGSMVGQDPTTTNEEWDEWFYGNLHITPMGSQTFNSGVSIGFDGRVSLTYNFGRYFFNAYGQFNNIRYHHNSTKGYLNDWFVNTSIGVRL